MEGEGVTRSRWYFQPLPRSYFIASDTVTGDVVKKTFLDNEEAT